MKIRLLMLTLAAILLPVAMGCGGSESSFQDRQGDIDPETVTNEMPDDMGAEPAP